MSESAPIQVPEELQRFSSIEQNQYSNGAKHVYGIDAQNGHKVHISNSLVLEAYGYGDRKSEDANRQGSSIGSTNNVPQMEDQIEDSDWEKLSNNDKLAEFANWQMKLSTTKTKREAPSIEPSGVKASERGLSVDDFRYQGTLQEMAEDNPANTGRSLREKMADEKEAERQSRLREMARTNMRVKTGIATPDEIAYYNTMRDISEQNPVETAAEKLAKAQAKLLPAFEKVLIALESNDTEAYSEALKALGKANDDFEESTGGSASDQLMRWHRELNELNRAKAGKTESETDETNEESEPSDEDQGEYILIDDEDEETGLYDQDMDTNEFEPYGEQIETDEPEPFDDNFNEDEFEQDQQGVVRPRFLQRAKARIVGVFTRATNGGVDNESREKMSRGKKIAVGAAAVAATGVAIYLLAKHGVHSGNGNHSNKIDAVNKTTTTLGGNKQSGAQEVFNHLSPAQKRAFHDMMGWENHYIDSNKLHGDPKKYEKAAKAFVKGLKYMASLGKNQTNSNLPHTL